MSMATAGASGNPIPRFESPPEPPDRMSAVRNGGTVMSCDAPAPGARDLPLPLPIRVMGWAYSRASIDGVTVLVDGTPVTATYGLFRGDVAETLAEPAAVRCGFTAVLDSDACPPGRHRLTVIAYDHDKRPTGVTMTVVALAGDDEADSADEDSSTSPAPEDEAERYVPEVHRGLPLEAEHQARYNWAAALAEGRDVLDAGCGVGWGTVRLAGAGSRRAVGVDIDEEAVQSGRERAGDLAEFVQGDLLALPFEDGTFDLVVSFEAIEHVSDPGKALDEMRRVLRPGGLLAISSPNKGIYPAGNRFHLHELTSAELETALQERFSEVAMYRQESHSGSLITDDRAHAADDPAAEIGGRLFKMWAGSPGQELYTIALAGDAELPEMPGVAMLGAPLDTKRFYERMADLEHQALLSGSALAAARGEVQQLSAERDRANEARYEAQEQRAGLQRELTKRESSLSWRITKPLRVAEWPLGGIRRRLGR